MKFSILSFIALMTLFALSTDAKKYMKCEMARMLTREYRFDRTFLAHWVCLIEHESDRNTTTVKRFPNGSARFGLFQISSKDWCREGRKGGFCNAKCEDFIDDNIADDVQCAREIFHREGFKHWNGWKRFCRNIHQIPNVYTFCGTSQRK